MAGGLTPRDHTRNVLARMNLAGSVPGNLDRDKDAQADNYGLTSAGSSDASSFKMTGAPKSPHMGRPGRQAGGRISGGLIRTRRTPQETAADIASEDQDINALAKDREGRARGGRLNRQAGGGMRSEGARDAENEERVRRMSAAEREEYSNERNGGRIGRWKGGPGRDVLGQKDAFASDAPGYGGDIPGGREYYNFIRGGLGTSKVGAPRGQGGIGSDVTAEPTNQAKGGRVGRAHGGRAKGKTTVNVIIAGDKHLGPQGGAMPPAMPPPPPMAAPGPAGPPRPPMGGTPMPMPIPMPVGGAPMGAAGAPPPGAPPMLRARGGRIGRQGGGQIPPDEQSVALAADAARERRLGERFPDATMLEAPRPWRGPPELRPLGRARGGKIEIETPGKHDYGKPGVKHGKVQETYGGGSGLGRQERAREQK